MASDLSGLAMEVPPEVLGRILAHLEKKDLKEVRLVCKKLERSAVSLLFDEVYLSTNLAEIEIAQNTVRNFGKSIKTVYFSAVEYKEMKWGYFKNSIVHSREKVEYVRLAYANYCRLRQEQQDMLRAGTYFGHLCYALRTIPNAQRLVINDFEAYSELLECNKRVSRLWRMGDCPAHCSIQGCDYGNLQHLGDMVGARSLLHAATLDTDLETLDANAWSLVMMGLAATGSQIKELSINSFLTGYVPRGGFDNTLQQPFALQDIFQHFVKLRLGFSLFSDIVERHIARTLSTATNLKSLCVTVERDTYDSMHCNPGRPTTLQEIFGECKFPQLRSLILDGFDSTGAELVGLLQGSSRLQHLTLTRHYLGSKGRWDSCANKIKVALPSLKHIVIDDVRSSADDFSYDDVHAHCYSHRDVQGFFFQGKANPFVCSQTQAKGIRVKFIGRFDGAEISPGVYVGHTVWQASYLKFH